MPDPERWGEGIEEALLEAVENEARAIGRPVVADVDTAPPRRTGDRLPSPTGFGIHSRGRPADEFMLRQRLRLRAGRAQQRLRPERLFRGHRAHAGGGDGDGGPGLPVMTWSTPTPDEYKDGFAYVISRMSTDAPRAGSSGRRRPGTPHASSAAISGCSRAARRLGRLRPAHPVRDDRRIQRAHDRPGPHRRRRTSGARSCSRSIGAPARHDREVREPAPLARAHARLPARVDLQRRGESPDAEHQRGDRLRPASYAGAWKKVLDA